MAETMDWWQQIPFHIRPYLFEIGGFQLRFYSLMYLAAFVTVYLLVQYRIRTEGFRLKPDLLLDFFTWAALGVLAGGRLGYVLFYDLNYYLQYPLQIILPLDFSDGIRFTGITGMSFHGGLLGVALVFYLFCRRQKINILTFSDLVVPAVPLGYFFGRLGNFINSELYGRPTTLPWGMFFPTDPARILRHPSQLYEAFFEGILLFVILWFNRHSSWTRHRMFALFLLGYGTFRFFIEYVRQPDTHLNFVWLNLTMGQMLCAAMITCGILLVAVPGRLHDKKVLP